MCLSLSLRLRYRLSGPPVIFPLCGPCDGPGSFSRSLHQRELHAALLQTAARQTHPAQRPGDHRPGVAQEPRLDIVSERTCTQVNLSYFLLYIRHCPLLDMSRFSVSALTCSNTLCAERTTSLQSSTTRSAWSTMPLGSFYNMNSNLTAAISPSLRTTKKNT